MNLFKGNEFFAPTSLFKELIILQHIEKEPNTTQKRLAEIADAAPSMINVYIGEYEKNGYMNREYISVKTVRYNITAKGIGRKNLLLSRCLEELKSLANISNESIEKE